MKSHRFDHPPDPGRAPFRRIVLILWAIALTVVCIRASVQKKKNKHASQLAGTIASTQTAAAAKTVAPPDDPEDLEGNWPKNSGYKTYYLAGKRWRDGRSLYRSLDDLSPEARQRKQKNTNDPDRTGRNSGAWGGFRYSPTAALLFVPLTYMSVPVGEVVWRVFLAAVSLGALFWCSRIGLPRPLARRDWPLLFLLVLPSVTGCLNNGQASCLIIGCLLGAIAAAYLDLWALAAVLVVIPTLLKLYPVAVGLLLSVMYPRRFSWRFALALVLGLALPFLIRPSTMPEEHRRWLWHLLNDAKPATDVQHWDYDLRLLLMRWFHLRLSMGGFMVVQVVAAAIIAAICLAGRLAGWPRRMLLARMLGLATCWMTVVGMATEPSTYILIAPALGWSLWEVWLRPPARAHLHPARGLPGGGVARGVLVSSYVLLLSTYVLFWFPWGGRVASRLAPEPLAGLLFFGYLLVRSVRELAAGARQSPARQVAAVEG